MEHDCSEQQCIEQYQSVKNKVNANSEQQIWTEQPGAIVIYLYCACVLIDLVVHCM